MFITREKATKIYPFDELPRKLQVLCDGNKIKFMYLYDTETRIEKFESILKCIYRYEECYKYGATALTILAEGCEISSDNRVKDMIDSYIHFVTGGTTVDSASADADTSIVEKSGAEPQNQDRFERQEIEKIEKKERDFMERMAFEREQLQQEYDERIAQLQQIAQSPALTKEVMWDKTAARYAETIAKIKRLMDEQELADEIPANLDKQLQTFLEKCTNPEFHIALVGAIKAGKSSLINAVLGEELASTEVTPETASLTKFRRSRGKNYVTVSFYSDSEWEALWKSASGVSDSKFMREYRALRAEQEKAKWVGKQAVHIDCDSKQELKDTIKKWTSSQSATHYFVKEVEVGLKEFDLPDGVILVDTPGLNDAVAYRSDITKNYINRANAVFVCVKADNLTGPELATITGVFSNTRYNPEKVYIIATQQDSLNEPIADWEKQRKVWLSYLEEKTCYGNRKLAEKNLISTSAYFYTLLTNRKNLNLKRNRQLCSTAMKMEGCMPNEIEINLNKLLNFTKIDCLKQRMDREIIAKYRELLVEDIKSNYDLCKANIQGVMEKIMAKQRELIDISTKGIEEIRAAQEEGRQRFAELEKEQMELAELVEAVKRQTSERTRQLEASIRSLAIHKSLVPQKF